MTEQFSRADFGKRLQAARKDRGVSQEVLAKRCGVYRTTVLSWEFGRQTPTADKVSLLAEALEVTPDFLMGWAE